MPSQFRFFRIQVRDNQEAAGELNRFLRSARVLNIQKEYTTLGENSYWSVAVDRAKKYGKLVIEILQDEIRKRKERDEKSEKSVQGNTTVQQSLPGRFF